MGSMNRRVEISQRTIFFITGFLVLLWVLYLIIDIILLLFVAFILVSALSPLVEKLVKLRLPRGLAILVVFLLVLGSLAILITLTLTPLLNQTANLVSSFSEAVTSLLRANSIDRSIVDRELSGFSGNLVSYTLSIFENLVTIASVVVITFYMLLDKNKIEDLATSFFVGRQQRVKKLIDRLEEKLGYWMRGQLILSLSIGVLYYIGLLSLNVPYALPLSILGGLLEVVPVIGPIIAAVPALVISLTLSPILAGVVAAFYFAVQQIENHIVVPQVMKRAVGLNPILVIVVVAIGGRLLGIGGALLAVPIAVVVQVILEDFLDNEAAFEALGH